MAAARLRPCEHVRQDERREAELPPIAAQPLVAVGGSQVPQNVR